MYILYYCYEDYGIHDLRFIAVSESTHVLEAEIERLMEPVREYDEKSEAIRKSHEAYYAKCQKKVREWLVQNQECVREIRPRMFNGEFYVKDFHTLNNTPYHPEVKKRELEKAIDVIVTTHWTLFLDKPTADVIKRQDEFIDREALKVPVIVLERKEYEYPKMKEGFAHYARDGFKIEKVAVL
jgi:hypothetical protein